MSDKFAGGIKAGSTDVSIAVILRSTTDNTETTGVAHTSVNASYWRQGGTRTDIDPASTLAAVDSAHSDKGWKEVDSTNMPGVYRFDLPDEVVNAGADWVVVSIVVSGSYAFVERYHLETKGAAENNAVLTNANYGLDKLVRSTTPAQSLSVDVNGRVDVSSIEGSDATNQITTACNAAIDTAISSPTSNSLAEYASRLTATRAGYIDTLNGNTAQSGDVYALLPQNFVDLAITSSTGQVTVNDLSATAKASVNAEVVDVMRTDQLPELASDPGATPTFAQAVMFDYHRHRCKRTQDGTDQKIYNDAGTLIITQSTTDTGVGGIATVNKPT